ncbi:MAG: dephospho-CoA kinase [Candidatus Ozemobacteraceae bacterium]
MFVCGMAGQIGSGKTTLGTFMAERFCGINLEVDQIGHLMLEQPDIRRALAATFGSSVRKADGTVDRHELGRRAFVNKASIALLNEIMHPPMVAEVKRIIAAEQARKTPLIVINAALLFTMHLDTLCEHSVYIRAAPDIRLQRLVTIRGLPIETARARLLAQDPEPPVSSRVSICTNDGTFDDLRSWIEEVLPSRLSFSE